MLGLLTATAGSGDAFQPGSLRAIDQAPSPLPRRVLAILLVMLALLAAGIAVGRLDVVAIAEGRLVPRTLINVVQPAEAGVLRELLVEEGAAVVHGQVLMRLDARVAEADLRAQRAAVADRLIQLRRIDAELGDVPLAPDDGDPPEAFRRALLQHGANRAAHRDAVALATTQVARVSQELAAALEIERKLDRTVPIAQTMAARYERLRSDGFVSELFALERERDRIEREQELKAQRHQVRALRASLEQAERQLDQVRSSAHRQLHAERAEAASQLSRLREDLDKLLVRHEQIELVAPAAAIVKDIGTRTVGAVVAAGTVLITLVPTAEPLEAEVLLRNEDAAFVRPGQRVQVKIAAYPFQKYGLLDASVLRVGPDSTEAAGRSPEERGVAGAYRARIALARQSLEHDGDRLPLASGMAAVAEIHLGRRPVADYLLGPVQKAWHESARER